MLPYLCGEERKPHNLTSSRHSNPNYSNSLLTPNGKDPSGNTRVHKPTKSKNGISTTKLNRIPKLSNVWKKLPLHYNPILDSPLTFISKELPYRMPSSACKTINTSDLTFLSL